MTAGGGGGAPGAEPGAGPGSGSSAAVTVLVTAIRNPVRLGACIDRVNRLASEDGVAADVVAVLDGPEPGLAESLAGRPDVRVLSWPERRGLAASLNTAFRDTATPFVLVLQDDAQPRPGWLRSLMATAAAHPAAGAVGSVTTWPDGRLQQAGSVIWAGGGTTNGWTGEAPPMSSFNKVRAVDYVSSSSMLVRREAWAEAGGFDEEYYPLMYVDADFCTALWNAGWQVLVEPGSVVVHERGGSSATSLRGFLYERHRRRFAAKWGAFVGDRPDGPASAEILRAAVERAAGWIDDPPVVRAAAAAAAAAAGPAETPLAVHLQRRIDLLQEYSAALEARLAGHDRALRYVWPAVGAVRRVQAAARRRLPLRYPPRTPSKR
ncbi:MAG: hypothetical protein QOE93_1469 [Actinomycetota bacterium]|nr:hypothetical protein [Actinomycetota bacterium]